MWTSFIGFMASGKSTVTRLLCASTRRPLVVCDDLVEARMGQSVAEIFAGQGEVAFRNQELAELAALEPARNLVVDTGGGVVETPEAVRLLRDRGVVVWLDTAWPEVRLRLERPDEADLRPLVGSLGWDGLEALHGRRRRLYAAAADFRLAAGRTDPAELARTAMLRSLFWERQREVAER